LGAVELALTRREVELLLRGLGVELPAADISKLANCTEGWPPGVYAARLTADDGRVGFAPFVLRAAESEPRRQLVVMPTNTWQAYNFYDRDGDGWGDTWYAGGSPAVDLTRPYRDRGVPPRVTPYDRAFLRWLARPGGTPDLFQLVLTDRSPFTRGRDFSVLSSRTWRLADLGAKHALLREGIGWGSMPLPMIEPDLVDGTLVRLALPDQQGIDYMFDAIYRTDTPPGPAGSWLLQHVAARHWA